MSASSTYPWVLGLILATIAVVVIVSIRRTKKDGRPGWDPRPPNFRERVFAGIWLLAFVMASANYAADWQLLGGYDKGAVLVLLVAGLVLLQLAPKASRSN